MEVGLYRYGTERVSGEGLRIGVTRHVPRGVPREDRARRGYFDLWLPLLAPSAELVKAYRGKEIEWSAFASRYRTEMKGSDCRQVIELLASFAAAAPVAIGCFCEEESRCHRSVLKELIESCAPVRPPGDTSLRSPSIGEEGRVGYASPPCWANWDDLE